MHGAGFEHGLQCIIDPDVVVGDDVKLGHRVHLASGTRVLNDVEIADDCVTTGITLIGNHVRVRTGSCISKSVIVDDWCFIAAGIMSSHTKNVYHGRPARAAPPARHALWLRHHHRQPHQHECGHHLAPGSIVGYGAHVVFDLETPHGIYYNDPDPWATLQSVLRPTNPFYIELPDDYVPHRFDPELLRRYLPHAPAEADPPRSVKRGLPPVTTAEIVAHLGELGLATAVIGTLLPSRRSPPSPPTPRPAPASSPGPGGPARRPAFAATADLFGRGGRGVDGALQSSGPGA